MVRVNLIDPKSLADQHLIAEYNEILMLLGSLDKHGFNEETCPSEYCLGKGHINFFKNKLNYLKKRHELIKKEMSSRGFKTEKTIPLEKYPRKLKNDWKPKREDIKLIKSRIIERLEMKPKYYRYNREYRETKFLTSLIEKSKVIEL